MSKYKNRLRAELNKTSRQGIEGLEIFFDDSKSVEERLEVFEKIGTFSNDENAKRAIALFRNTNQNSSLRALALEGLIHQVGQEETLMDEVIGLIDDQEIAVELRAAAISVLQACSFSSPIFPSRRPAYYNALKSVIDDQDVGLKTTAMEYLSLAGDEYMQRRLLECLEDAKSQLIQPELAIQLLSYDLHADHFPVLRKIAKDPPNPESKKEALRNLAADSESKDLLVEVMKDLSEDPQLRHLCTVALQQQSPDETMAYAKKVILSTEEDEMLKTAMLNTLINTTPRALLKQDLAFYEQLKKVEGENKSNAFKKVYAQCQNCMEGGSDE